MNRMAMAVAAVLCLIASSALGWWDTQILRLRQWPLEQVVEAESARDVPQAAIVADRNAFGDRAVRTNAKDPQFKMVFKNLDIGVYGVFISARADKDQIDRVRRPVYFDLRIDSGPRGEVAHHRVRVCYGILYEAVAHIYFQANRKGDYRAEISMGPESQAELIIDRFELRNPLAGIPRRRVKKGPSFFTGAEREKLWKEAAEGKPKYKSPLTYFDKTANVKTPEERRTRDDNIWRALPPINTPLQRGRYGGARKNLNAVLKALDVEKKHGKWERLEETHQNMYNWRVPITLVNKKLDLKYTCEDLVAGRPLPKPWPWPDSGWGHFFDREKVKAMVGLEKAKSIAEHAYFCPVAEHIGTQYGSFEAALTSSPYPHPGLPHRYHTDGDLHAARDGAFALAIYAHNYPAMNNRALTLGMIDSPQALAAGSRFTQSNAGYGKTINYSCSAAHVFNNLLTAYDKLFDFIAGNQELANALGRYIPWIRTPDDVLMMIDRRLVQHGLLALDNMRLRCGQGGWENTASRLALALGPCETADRVWNLLFTRAYMDMTNSGGFQDHYVCSYSRDGINHMGSASYSAGSYIAALEIADRLQRYVALGGKAPYPMHKPEFYPRLVQSARMALALQANGGLVPVLGDAGDLRRGRVFAGNRGSRLTFGLDFAWTKSPEAAWMLKNVIGRDKETDEEWDEIEKAAAQVRDPRLHQASRAAAGFGLTFLENGEESDDFRFKRTIAFRTGIARGHAQQDALNIDLFALGCRMASDLGGRHEGNAKGHPNMMSSRSHNTVEVNGTSFFSVAGNGSAWAWLDEFRPAPGCDYVKGSATCQRLPGTTLYRRAVALIAIDEGRPAKKPPSEPVYGANQRLDPDIEFPSSYVFDVFRVAGGSLHSWCFHGAHSLEEKQEDGATLPALVINADLKSASLAEAKRYLADFRKGTEREGACPEVLEAVWRLEHPYEKRYMGVNFNPDGPRRYTRVTMLGCKGDTVLVANGWSDRYKYDFPFLYVQKRAGDGKLESVFPAIIEACAGEPGVTAARLLKVTPNETDAKRAVAIEVKTKNGRTDLCFQDERPETRRKVAGGVELAAGFAYYSRDAKGPRLLHLVGGTHFAAPGLSVKAERAAWTGRIASMDPDKREIQLDAALPDKGLEGVEFQLGNPQHWTTNRIAAVRPGRGGSVVTYALTAKIYQSAVTWMDGKTRKVNVEIEPPLMNADERYYDGTTAADEGNRHFWRPEIIRDERWMYLGWPDAQRHAQRMIDVEVMDADGDGKRVLHMYESTEDCRADKTKRLLDLEVTRVDPEAMIFYFKMPVDKKYQTGGWPYWNRRLINENGSKEWRAHYPGTVAAFRLEGEAPVSDNTLADADGDGRRMIHLYDFGPGDIVHIPTQVLVTRGDDGKLRVRSDAKVELEIGN